MNITPGEKKKLERLAKRLVILTPSGPGAGEIGNISALIRSIAAEEITLQRDDDAGEEGAQD